MNYTRKQFFFAVIFYVLLFAMAVRTPVFAQEFSGSSYKVLDPVIAPGGFSSSASYQLLGVFTQLATGTSSAASFGNNAGFLAYPFVSTPVVSATEGDEEVDLSWTTSSGFLGWTVSGYDVGQATVAGGPYTYTVVGNVTSETVTSLTNDTTYYFIVRPLDAFGNAIATSSEVLATPDDGSTPPPSGGGGGGGGGGGILPPIISTGDTSVTLSGRAYPNSRIFLLKDGQISVQTIAGPDANFQMSLTALAAGSYNFGVYGEDKGRRRSATVSFPITLASGASTRISGIYLAPSIATDKSEVRKGDTIAIFGQSVPAGEITIQVNSEQEFFVRTRADSIGVYLINFDTVPLELGSHSTQARSATSTEASSFGTPALFKVGTKNVLATEKTLPTKANLNNDDRINLSDFSIAAFWYKRPLDERMKAVEKEMLNGDGVINIIDFSILAYHWTG